MADLATGLVRTWGSGRWITPEGVSSDVEAKTLRIAIDKAESVLGWRPRWGLDETIGRTVTWYRQYYQGSGGSMRTRSLEDIEAYMAVVRSADVS